MTGAAYTKSPIVGKESVVLTVMKDGDGLRPALICVLCQMEGSMWDDWIAFRPLDADQPATATEFVHRRCVNGHVKRLFGVPHVTLWRGADVWRRLVSGS